MSVTGEARRSDSLYYDNTVSRRTLCDMIARLESKRKGRHVIVADEATDCATGYCRCSACGRGIDMWDRFCKWCGTEMEQ